MHTQNAQETNVSYDLPRNVYDGVDGSLWERFSGSLTGARKLAHIHARQLAEELRDLCTPLVFVLHWPVKRSGVRGIREVVVQWLLEKIQAPCLKSLVPFFHELALWGIGV